MTLKITVIYGSVRRERQGIRAARYLLKKTLERGYEADLIDPVFYPLPLIDRSTHEYAYEKDMPVGVQKLSRIFKNSDAFVIVTGEYNHSVPPALKNMLDHFHGEFSFKPCGIASYSKGIFGGIRAAEHLRNIMCELGSPSIRAMFVAPKVQNSFDEEGNALDGFYEKKALKFFNELEWYAAALKEARLKGTPG